MEMKGMLTIRKRFAVIAVAACALGAGFGATAEQASAATESETAAASSWYWSETLAKHRLKGQDIAWNDGGYTNVVDARCSGRGAFIWNDYGTEKLYQRFVCVGLAENGKTFAVKVNVVNRFNFRVNFIGLV
jgi:hypothetical protein